MAKPRYLTKSRFKLAIECPTKLFYTGKSTYANQNLDDSFLLALAEGGFQVGELAKCYFPDGHYIKSLDYEQALQETNALLQDRHHMKQILPIKIFYSCRYPSENESHSLL